jgi:hypothetical protein
MKHYKPPRIDLIPVELIKTHTADFKLTVFGRRKINKEKVKIYCYYMFIKWQTKLVVAVCD